MTDINLNLARKINTERQRQLETIRLTYPELFQPTRPSEDYIAELCPFLFNKPQKFYREEVYENALKYVTDYYASNPNSLVIHFSYIAAELNSGAIATAYFSRDIEYNPTDQLDREMKIRRYWAPWYVNLVEACFKEVCSPWFWAITQSRGQNSKLETTDIYNRKQTIDTENILIGLTQYYNNIVRNGCAHGGITLLSDGNLLFIDSRGNRVEWSDHEFFGNIRGMVDICNALVLAAKVFIFRNWSQVSPFFSYQSLPLHAREAFFVADASTVSVVVQSAELRPLQGSVLQATIEATDTALTTEELGLDALAILQRVHNFYPEANQIFLSLNGSRHLPSWIRTPTVVLGQWLDGNITFEQFYRTADVEFMIFPFKPLPASKRLAALRRGVAKSWPEFRENLRGIARGYQKKWAILDVQDKSTGPAKRLKGIILIPAGLSRLEIEKMLPEITLHIKSKMYRTEEKKGHKRKYRRWIATRPARYIWLELYTKEKRLSDMYCDKNLSYFICRTEWIDKIGRREGLQTILNLPERINGTDIEVEWSNRYA